MSELRTHATSQIVLVKPKISFNWLGFCWLSATTLKLMMGTEVYDLARMLVYEVQYSVASYTCFRQGRLRRQAKYQALPVSPASRKVCRNTACTSTLEPKSCKYVSSYIHSSVVVPHFLLHILQLLFSSVQVQGLTFFPSVLVVMAVNRRVGTLSDETCLVKSKVCCTSVSPFQRDFVFLQILLRDCCVSTFM